MVVLGGVAVSHDQGTPVADYIECEMRGDGTLLALVG